jgi:hypothetical protein
MAKVLSTVLRGLGPSNGVRLLGRQSGEATDRSKPSDNVPPLARVASEPRGNGASASSEAEVGLGCR